MQIAEQTERDIDVTRSQYIPVAVNTQILFFCVSDLSNIDPMYQYSLEWFITIFLHGIANADKSGIQLHSALQLTASEYVILTKQALHESRELTLKGWVFRRLSKSGRDGVDVTFRGKTFQVQAAAIGKARSPTVDNRVLRTGHAP